MKMTMKFATGVVAEGVTDDGKKVQIKSLELQPFFLTAKGQSELLSVKSISDRGIEIEELAFLVSGSNGKLAKKGRQHVEENVVADIDKREPPKEDESLTDLDAAEPGVDLDDEEEDDFAEGD
jgi:hypothetical protein